MSFKLFLAYFRASSCLKKLVITFSTEKMFTLLTGTKQHSIADILLEEIESFEASLTLKDFFVLILRLHHHVLCFDQDYIQLLLNI